MEQPLERPEKALSPQAREAVRATAAPREIERMQPVSRAPEDPGAGWLLEPILDRRRCLAVLDDSELELYENDTDRIDARYPDLEKTPTAPGDVVFSRAENERWLGVVGKRGESPYVFGPSPDWRVWRCPAR